MVTVFRATRGSSSLTGAPNFCEKAAGSTDCDNSLIADSRDDSRKPARLSVPATPAVLQAVSSRPWMPPTNFVPNRSARYAGMVANPPPYIDTISIVTA
jgi:hypothetical protein